MSNKNLSPISAVIISLNEGANIQRCLESLRFCDDIILVDSGSTDNTIAIAKTMGARIITQNWLGFGKQKQFAVKQAHHDWILSIDADEVVSQELQKEIRSLSLAVSTTAVYQFPRRNHFLGRALRYGEGYPDISRRLFNRRKARWSEDLVHEKVVTSSAIQTLRGDLLHYSQDNISNYLKKQACYTDLQAQQLVAKGKKIHAYKCFTSPVLRFIKYYLIKGGFLDGAPGFIHIAIGCFTAFCKYAKAFELQKLDNSIDYES